MLDGYVMPTSMAMYDEVEAKAASAAQREKELEVQSALALATETRKERSVRRCPPEELG